MKIVFILHQVGHYHHARFSKLAEKCTLTVVEIFYDSKEYAWDTEFENSNYKRVKLSQDNSIKKILKNELPDKVFACGWSSVVYVKALVWCKLNKTPIWSVSDSRFEDKPRKFIVEKLKSILVNRFDGFLVAGTKSEEYLRYLGYNREIRQPWDVIDNDYFFTKVQEQEPPEYDLYNLPANYLLFNARYVEKKNHAMIIECYSCLKDDGIELMPVVCIGNGELKVQLIDLVDKRGLSDYFYFLDFVQYSMLPFFYKNAKFLLFPSLTDQWGLVVNESLASGTPVIATKNCGSSHDLVMDKKNGFIIDPHHHSFISTYQTLINLSDEEYMVMKKNTYSIVGFSLEDFVDSVIQ